MAFTDVLTKFQELDSKCTNMQLKAHETKGKVAGGLLPEQSLRDAIEGAEECCLRFRGWCAQKRDGILEMLDNPGQEFSPADRESLNRFSDEVASRLRDLDAECANLVKEHYPQL